MTEKPKQPKRRRLSKEDRAELGQFACETASNFLANGLSPCGVVRHTIDGETIEVVFGKPSPDNDQIAPNPWDSAFDKPPKKPADGA